MIISLLISPLLLLSLSFSLFFSLCLSPSPCKQTRIHTQTRTSFQVRNGTAMLCMKSSRCVILLSLACPTAKATLFSHVSHYFFPLALSLPTCPTFSDQPWLFYLLGLTPRPLPPHHPLLRLSFCGSDPWFSESRPSVVAHFPAKAPYSINIQAVEIDWWQIKRVENLSGKASVSISQWVTNQKPSSVAWWVGVGYVLMFLTLGLI